MPQNTSSDLFITTASIERKQRVEDDEEEELEALKASMAF
jgi:hypothetical protein